MKTITILGLAALMLCGCATPPRIDRMVTLAPLHGVAPSALRGNIAVRAAGVGKAVNPVWASALGGGRFEQALEASLRNARLLSAAKGAGSYVLVANLENVEPGNSGNAMRSMLRVSYSMMERATGREVLASTITIPCNESVAPESAADSLRVVNEGAVRMSIEKIIEELFAIGPGKVV